MSVVNGEDFREPVYWLNKVNLKTYTHKTGAELSALSNIQIGKIYKCSETGNGFILNNYYMRNENDTNWIVVFSIGGYQEIIASAIRRGGFFSQHYLRKMMFKNETSGSGSITDDDVDGGCNISTGATTGGRAQLTLEESGCPCDFSCPMAMKFKMQLNDSKNITGRVGMGMNDLATVPSTAVRHFGLEIENATTNQTFWSLRSGNGTTTSSQITSHTPISQNNTFRYILEYIPNVAIKMYVNGYLVATKTTDLPNSGIPSTRTFVVGIRTKSDDDNTIDFRSLVLAFTNGDLY